MSFNRVVTHEAHAYVQAVIDGHEDWQSALQVIEEMTDAAEAHDLSRIMLDFSTVDMRVAVTETADIARIFDSFAHRPMDLAIIPPLESKGRDTVEAFAGHVEAMGHTVSLLITKQARAEWIGVNNASKAV